MSRGIVSAGKPFAGVRALSMMAALIAAEVVLSRFLSFSVWNMKIGFAFLPVALAAMLLGPVQAGLVGGVADFLGAVLFPIGAYFPGFTLTAFLMGLVFGLFLHGKATFLRILGAVGVNQLLLGLLLNTLWISVLYGSPFAPLLVTRLTQCAILIPVQVITIAVLTRTMGGYLQRTAAQAVQEAKRGQRSQGRAARRAITQEARGRFDEAICRSIMDWDAFKDAGTVMTFCHFDGEPDITAVAEAAERAGKRVAYPYCEDATRLSALIPAGAECMAPGRYGILSPDPARATVCDPAEIELVLVSCAAFDRRGYRMGMGAGYYDRFLRACANAQVCVVAYEAQRAKRVVTEAHDVPCGYIVTERGLRKAER